MRLAHGFWLAELAGRFLLGRAGDPWLGADYGDDRQRQQRGQQDQG
jgi:hypothetical protein